MMLERLTARVTRRAREMAARRAELIAEALAAEPLPGMRAQAAEGGVALSGRGLRRRLANEPRLRWSILGAGR
jgi:hypothetical protein